jgi:integration host factor subunit beta
MIKSELVARIAAQNPHLYRRDAEKVIDAILDQIGSALAQGNRVQLRGFGAFSVRVRHARTGRDPRTGTVVHVPKRSCRTQTGEGDAGSSQLDCDRC